jgi:hypothetical protein
VESGKSWKAIRGHVEMSDRLEFSGVVRIAAGQQRCHSLYASALVNLIQLRLSRDIILSIAEETKSWRELSI